MKTSFFFLCLCLVINVITFGQGEMNIEQEFMTNEYVEESYDTLSPLDSLLLDFITEINKERKIFGVDTLTINKNHSRMAQRVNKKMIRFEVVKNYKSGGLEDIHLISSRYSTDVSGLVFTVHKYSDDFGAKDFLNQIRNFCFMDILMNSKYSEIIVSLEVDEESGLLYNTMILRK